MPRIALIHAVEAAVDPVKQAFAELWPQAGLMNLLDDSLSVDRQRDGRLTDAMAGRIGTLGDYAMNAGCDGVLYTCSAFGAAIEAFARRANVPVLKPNEAMFNEALARGERIGMLATFTPSVAGMEAEFAEQARALGKPATIRTIVIDKAMDALRAGDADTHNGLLADAVGDLGEVDAVMLAQFSTSRAFAAVSARTDKPVLTSPHSAVRTMREKCGA
jgi:Asp/Glu/hydantoin racemase